MGIARRLAPSLALAVLVVGAAMLVSRVIHQLTGDSPGEGLVVLIVVAVVLLSGVGKIVGRLARRGHR